VLGTPGSRENVRSCILPFYWYPTQFPYYIY
jgi:hypothetical protein